ncbi:hypothetical protein FHR32_008259 [Streptosporangium album]|uniref:Uncharacterized protein n=1 Tax=Streptosporangium album TaxID=47479 RepID=A0A7W7WEG6_9ACTN|nr:hypothetical protein [Streptosporangium album]
MVPGRAVIALTSSSPVPGAVRELRHWYGPARRL